MRGLALPRMFVSAVRMFWGLLESGETDGSVEYNLARVGIEATDETELAEVRVVLSPAKLAQRGTDSTTCIT